MNQRIDYNIQRVESDDLGFLNVENVKNICQTSF